MGYIFMEPVVTYFVLHKEHNEHGTSQPETQPYNIDEGINFIPQQVPPGGFKIVPYHNRYLLKLFIYSVLKLFTGLASAAFIAWKLTVTSAIMMATSPPAANNHQLMLMR